MHVRNLSIRINLTLLILFASGLSVLLASFGFGIYERSNYRSSAVRELTALADTLGANSAASLAFEDKKTAREMLGALATEPHVLVARLYDNEGNSFAEYRSRSNGQNRIILSGLRPDGAYFDRKSLALFRGVLLNGQRTGSIALVFDMGDLRFQLLQYVKIATVVLLLSVLVTFVASLRLTVSIGAPFVQLAAVARQVSTEKDYSVRAKVGAGGEAGLLIRSFNDMLSQIEASNSQLRQHREHLEEQVAFRTSELVAASGQLKLQSEALNAASNAIIITDLEGKIVWCNPAFSALSGYRLDEVLGKNPSLLRSGRQDREFYKQMWATITAGANWNGEIINRRKDGTFYIEDMTIAPVASQAGAISHFVAIKQNVTERRRAEDALRISEEQYRLLFASNPVPMWVFDRSTLRFLAVNSAASRRYGFTETEFLAMTIKDIRPDEEVHGLLKSVSRRLHGLQEPEVWKHRKKNGAIIDVELVCHSLDFHGNDAMLVAAYDITEQNRSRQMLKESENKYRVLFEDSADAFWILDHEGAVDCNAAALQLFGFSAKAEFKHPADISPTNQPDGRSSRIAADEKMAAAFLTGKERFEWLHRRKNGDLFHAEVCLAAISLQGQRLLLANVRDVTERKVAEQRVQFLAYFDALTSLPNRTLLEDRISRALASAHRRKESAAVLFLDLDRFKIINDTLGHSAGDLLLQEVAARLKTWAREQDTVARVGGDEFVVLLTNIAHASDAAAAAQRVIHAVTADFSLKGNPINITCSVGISMFPENGVDGETLIKNADAAMYCAKQKGPNNIQFFTKDMNDQMVERLTVESGLRLALDRQELFLVYQPQMDIASGEIIGVEALLRWQHPELGLVPPDRFIRIAENTGLIVPIGEWVLKTACAQARKWQAEGFRKLQIAVNVSAVQFRQDGFRDHIRSVLHETGLASQYLELELTESLLLSNADVMFSVLRELKEMGLSLAIDDFGTGYSSLSYLRQFPVSKLKIDRSFIQDVAINPDDAAITAAIIGMAKNLNLKVIAEGVENEAQLSFLRAHHCDEIQGYYFSRPLSADKVADMLRGNKIEVAPSPRRAETIYFGRDLNAHSSVTDKVAS